MRGGNSLPTQAACPCRRPDCSLGFPIPHLCKCVCTVAVFYKKIKMPLRVRVCVCHHEERAAER